MVKSLFPKGRFHEILVTCKPETAQQRDPKGLYDKAKKGEIKGLTGYDEQHEISNEHSIVIDTDKTMVDESLLIILDKINSED